MSQEYTQSEKDAFAAGYTKAMSLQMFGNKALERHDAEVRKLDLECISTRTGERDAYKLESERLSALIKTLVEALEKVQKLAEQELGLPRYEPAVTATLTDIERVAGAALASVKEQP